MPVNVDEIVSNVQPEPEASAAATPADPEWKRAAEMRQLMACIERDRRRNAADGFDD
jgi:hypothetical protein